MGDSNTSLAAEAAETRLIEEEVREAGEIVARNNKQTVERKVMMRERDGR